MSRVGIPSCAVRLICHVPVGMVSVIGMRLYDAARNLDKSIFDVIPAGGTFLHGLQIVGQAGTATFVWNTIHYLFSCLWSGPFLGLVGIIDLGLAGVLISGIAYQHRFLPGSYGECDSAASWKNGSDGRNFFAVLARDTDRPDAVCRDFVRNWILAIVLVTLYLICGTVNVILGLGEKYVLPPVASKEEPQPVVQGQTSQHDRQKEKGDYYAVYACLLIFGCVLLFMKHALPATRFGFRYASKFLASLRQGTSSPAMAEAKATRQHDCTASSVSTKTQCYVCMTRICTLCQREVEMHETTEAFQHLMECFPWCSRCAYYHVYMEPRPPSWSYPASHSSVRKPVCGACYSKSSKEREDLRETRDVFEVRRLTRLPLVCRECKEPLKATGPRWWINPHTEQECRHKSHPGWARW